MHYSTSGGPSARSKRSQTRKEAASIEQPSQPASERTSERMNATASAGLFVGLGWLVRWAHHSQSAGAPLQLERCDDATRGAALVVHRARTPSERAAHRNNAPPPDSAPPF